jgi:hypothetical protein
MSPEEFNTIDTPRTQAALGGHVAIRPVLGKAYAEMERMERELIVTRELLRDTMVVIAAAARNAGKGSMNDEETWHLKPAETRDLNIRLEVYREDRQHIGL